MARPKHIDHIMRDWPFRFGEVLVRKVRGSNNRTVLQIRVDLGVMQLETKGRPDNSQPHGFATYFDYIKHLHKSQGNEFLLTAENCIEIDREFVQYYYRRIAWLALKDFKRAIQDADHTLALMDFSTEHSPEDEWATMHEQYRPFVLFHRTQAKALLEIDRNQPEEAVKAINAGLEAMRKVFEHFEIEDEFDEDDLTQKLNEMRDSLKSHFEIAPSLTEQLKKAIASEKYELAADLRDKIAADKTLE